MSKVVYPGLKAHPQHDIATRQQNGYGAMITFYCVGGRAQAATILQNVSQVLVSTAYVVPKRMDAYSNFKSSYLCTAPCIRTS